MLFLLIFMGASSAAPAALPAADQARTWVVPERKTVFELPARKTEWEVE